MEIESLANFLHSSRGLEVEFNSADPRVPRDAIVSLAFHKAKQRTTGKIESLEKFEQEAHREYSVEQAAGDLIGFISDNVIVHHTPGLPYDISVGLVKFDVKLSSGATVTQQKTEHSWISNPAFGELIIYLVFEPIDECWIRFKGAFLPDEIEWKEGQGSTYYVYKEDIEWI